MLKFCCVLCTHDYIMFWDIMNISETQPYRTFCVLHYLHFTHYSWKYYDYDCLGSLNDHSKKHHKKPYVLMSTANCYSYHSYRLPYLINSYEPQANYYHKIMHFFSFLKCLPRYKCWIHLWFDRLFSRYMCVSSCHSISTWILQF